MKDHMTIDRIAQLAGVNRSTVSRALNPRTAGLISAGLRERIVALCDEHLYRPRKAAKAFARGKTSTIALVLGDMTRDLLSPVFAEFMTGLSLGVQRHGYALNILNLDYQDPHHEEQLRDMLLSEQADGYVMGASIITERIGSLIQTLHTPVISLVQYKDFPFQVPAVITSDEKAIAELLKLLPKDFRGHCLFVGAVGAETECKKNLISQQLHQLGMEADFFQYRDFVSAHKGVHVGRYNGQHFTEENLEYLRQFRFIWCAADLNALGMCDVLKRNGVTPGKDLFLAGFDNIERIFSTPEPFLSTIDPCPREMGTMTADYIMEGIRQPDRLATNLLIDSQLVLRQSYSVLSIS